MYKGVNLIKEVKDLYTKIYKILMKEIKEDTNKWKDVLCPRIRRVNLAKIVPSIYLIQFLSKSPWHFSMK